MAIGKVHMIFCRGYFKKYSVALSLLFLLLYPCLLRSEYYQYIDKNGVKVFTDDQSLIRNTQTGKAKVYKEKYDYLDEEQKNELIRQEQETVEKAKKNTREDLERMKQQEETKRENQEQIQKQKQLEELKTPIAITRNKVLVPVILKHASKEVSTVLLLDTGASITTVNQSVVEKLGINEGKSSTATVAGGGIIKTKLVKVQHIKVDPKTIDAPTIMVLEGKESPSGFQGLLGQDFLQQFSFTIDYGQSVIRWKE